MNKTISINISGLSFIIEEDAYHKLQDYLEQIRKHCGPDTDAEEVISDIESVIAPKLRLLITPYKDVITMEDIDSVIKVMGTTEDFDREVGGIHEENKQDFKVKRKLYRDSEEFIVGGVAQGLGMYFDVDPVLFRVAFVLLTFVSGFGLLAYLILWVAVPEAKTAKQKLEMKGEAPTVAAFEKLSKIEKKIKIDFKERWNKFPAMGKILSIPILIFNSFLNLFKRIISKIGPIFKFLIGLFFLMVSLFFLGFVGVGSLYLLLQTHSSYSFAFIPIVELFKVVPFFWIVITGFLSFAIPAVLLLIGSLALLRNKRFITFNLGIILLSTWMISGISFCALSLRYIPDVFFKIRNYPDIQSITKVVDVKDADKIIVNGPYFNVFLDKNKNENPFMEGRVIDINSVEIQRNDKDITLMWQDINRDLCFNCSNEPVSLILDKDSLSKVKLENGAQIIK